MDYTGRTSEISAKRISKIEGARDSTNDQVGQRQGFGVFVAVNWLIQTRSAGAVYIDFWDYSRVLCSSIIGMALKLQMCLLNGLRIVPSPCLIKRIGKMAYRVSLPEKLARVHDVFHVSYLRKCLHKSAERVEPSQLEEVEVESTDAVRHLPTKIIRHDTKQLRNKMVKMVKVQWGDSVEDATWETEEKMQNKYPHLFNGINAPTSQSLFNYFLLAVIYGGLLIYRRKPLRMPWYYYLVLSFVDVEANYLVVKAYQYTSLTSVMLLDCWSIPSVMFLTWIFLKTKYRLKKFTGVAICVAGLVLVVFSDVHAHDRGGGSNPLKGDFLVIGGSMLYAISNVGEEYLVKKGDRVELMALLGLFGAFVSAVQISVLERDELRSIHWTAGAVLPFVGFDVAMFLFYSTVPIILKMSGSTMLNLSLLTSDMWAVLIRIFAYHQKVDWMYFISFGAVAVGLVVYSVGDKEQNQDVNVAQIPEANREGDKEKDEEAAVDEPAQNHSAK